MEVDEGDPFNELLHAKGLNNIKALNIFKTVNSETIEGSSPSSKIINIEVVEKPTGEISLGAGVGSDGGTVGFSVSENNFLGNGIGLDTNALISSSQFKGKFTVTNPNYKNSDKSLYGSLEATESDNYNTFGYKTNVEMFNYIKDNLSFDNLIWEFGDNNNPAWVHVSFVSEDQNRNQVLKAYKEQGTTIYKIY